MANKRRVVVTGMGIVSCLGNDVSSVEKSLRDSISGIKFNPSYEEVKMRSQVSGSVRGIEPKELIDRKDLRFMGDAAIYAHIAMQQAVTDSGLESTHISNPRTGIITGSGGSAPVSQHKATKIMLEKGVRRVGPYWVPQMMASTTSACLATSFKIRGINYSIASACATSAHCIGNAAQHIEMDLQDVVFAGGGEEESWALSFIFDAMGALSTRYNDTPETASRPYDAARDGFVIAGGGGIIVLEELEHARARGATIYAELTGYGATSDGVDMVAPSGEGAVRCMELALGTSKQKVDYINTHGTSTPVGDIVELNAIKDVFGEEIPKISSTKSLTGHSLGAAGVHEAIYCLIMLNSDFIAGSANLENIDDDAKGFPVQAKSTDAKLNCILSNSFGFGGTNASLVFERLSS